MSGTSLDGVDGVIVDLAASARFHVLAHRHLPFASALRTQLLDLNQSGPDELHLAALAGNGVARTYADVVRDLLGQVRADPGAVRAIGAHGQTVRHRPREFDGIGYTVQLINAALLAELAGIDVVADFRSRDVAAGGQGAPLVPAFHQAAFGRLDRDLAVLNIGGMVNVTFLPARGLVSGHDCGPGNVLLDLWCLRHLGQPLDEHGHWGRTGRLLPNLLAGMLADDFITRQPPKSTGRDHFHADWLARMLQRHGGAAEAPQVIQHTLAWLTARAAADSIRASLPSANELLVCGGGALNAHLMDCLRTDLPGVHVTTIDKASALDPMHVEAVAFAWLAQAHMARHTGNLSAVTGAAGARILGACYPA